MSQLEQTNATHNPALQSWVESANAADTDFPVQNLPFGRIRLGADSAWRIGVAIGDQVLDLRGAGLIDHNDMARVLNLAPEARQQLRARISAGLSKGSAEQTAWSAQLHAQSAVELGLPCDIRDYTDFYVGIHHATTVGKLFRPDNPLLPNYQWVPIGYHGRASTVMASGKDFHRPVGQTKGPNDAAPRLTPSARLDFELEMGLIVGRGNAVGVRVPMEQAEDHLFGMTLFNDWSARDLQAWEYQPLGPFLSKSFASTISPWIVTFDALTPYRLPFSRPEGDPQPLPYLDSAANRAQGALDISLEVYLQTARMREAGLAAVKISQSNYAQAAYWTAAQLIAHHTVNGCSLSSGDLFGTGTLSGALPGQSGSMLELSQGGQHAITLPNGETRSFLQDGDAVSLRGFCSRPGLARIGFGECTATVLPALQ